MRSVALAANLLPSARSSRAALFSRTALCGALSVAAALASAGVTQAGPTGATIPSGVANTPTITTPSAGQTTVTLNQSRTIIDWKSFDIAKGETVDFVFKSPSGIALNRVSGAASINGALNGCVVTCATIGGAVWIYAPNGVIFGPNARVNVGSFLASTAAPSEADFLSGSYNLTFKGGDPLGRIQVQPGAELNAHGGSLALIAPEVETQAGSSMTSAGTTLLGAAQNFRIHFDESAGGDLDLFDFQVPSSALEDGTISAKPLSVNGKVAGGSVILAAVSRPSVMNAVISLGGLITATKAESGQGGSIVLTASGSTGSTVDVSGALRAAAGKIDVTAPNLSLEGKIDVSAPAGGGAVRLGGGSAGQDATIANANTLTVAPGSVIDASATDRGDGGSVTLWSNTATDFRGTILSRGGPNGGNGGNAEVSGGWLNYGGLTDLTAAKGGWGTLLLDPDTVNILSSGTGGGTISGGLNTDAGDNTTTSISVGQINTALDTADVTIQTYHTGGTITFNDGGGAYAFDHVSATPAHTAGLLTFSSDNFTFSAAQAISAGSGISLSFIQNGALTLNTALSTVATGAVTTPPPTAGSISLRGTSVAVNAAVTAGTGLAGENVTLTATAGGIAQNATSPITANLLTATATSNGGLAGVGSSIGASGGVPATINLSATANNVLQFTGATHLGAGGDAAPGDTSITLKDNSTSLALVGSGVSSVNNDVLLSNSGSITQPGPGGAISAKNLSVSSTTGSVALGGANSVNMLATASTAAGQTVTFANNAALTLGAITTAGSLVVITSSGNNLTVGGAQSVGQNLSLTATGATLGAGGGTPTISVGGDYAVTANAFADPTVVLAPTLGAASDFSITKASGAFDLGTIGTRTIPGTLSVTTAAGDITGSMSDTLLQAGAVSLTASGALPSVEALKATVGGITLTAHNGAVHLIGAQTAATAATLSGTGLVDQTSGATITAATLSANSSAGAVTLNSANAVGKLTRLTAAAGNAASFTNANGFTVDSAVMLGGSGVALTATTGDLEFLGDLTLGRPLSATAGGAVTFDHTINGAYGLTTSGTTTIFKDVVGGGAGTALASLSVTGASQAAANITTSGLMSLGTGLTLTGDSTLTSGGAITVGAIDSDTVGPHALTVASTATGFTSGAIGANHDLSSLDVKAPATLSGGVTTTGAITFEGTLTLTGASTLKSSGTGAAGAVSVTTVNSDAVGTPRAFGVSTGGGFTAGVLGGTTKLASLSLTAASASLSTGNSVGILAANLTGASSPLTFDNGSNALAVGAVMGGATGVTTNNGVVTLNAGAITQTAAITAASLKVTSADSVTLDSANNVGVFAASLTGAGKALSFNNGANALSIGTVGATSGVTTNNGAATLGAGVLTLNQAVNIGSGAGGGALSLNPTGVLTQAAAGIITAHTLQVSASDDVTLANASNTFGSLLASSAVSGITGKAFTLRNSSALSIDGNVTGGAVSFTSDSTITQNSGVINAASLTGAATGGATFNQANKIGALADFTVNTTGAFSLKNDTSTGLTVTGTVSAPGAVGIQSAGLTVGNGATGSVQAGTGVALTSTGAGNALALNGNVNASTSAGNAVALTSGGNITEGATGKITAYTATIDAIGSVSLNSANVLTHLDNITTGGDTSVTNAGDLVVTGTFIPKTSTTPKLALISTNGNLTIQNAIDAPSDLTLKAGGAGPSGILNTQTNTVHGDYSITAASFAGSALHPVFVGSANNFSITETAGNVDIATAGGTMTPGTFSVTASNGTITDSTPASVIQAGGLSFTGTSVTVGALKATMADIALHATAGSVQVDGTLTATSGNIGLSAISGAVQLGGSLTASGHGVTLSATGGGISQTVGGITSATLSAVGTGSVALGGSNAVGELVNLDGAGASYSGSSGGVLKVDAANAHSGALSIIDTGGLNLVGAVSAGTSAGLTAGGAITEDVTNGLITASTLTASSSGGLTLGGANQVATVTSLVNTGSGGLSFTDARTGAISVATVNSGSGSLTLNAVGATDLTGALTATGQTATLNTAGALTQSGGSITAGTLLAASSGGSVTLNHAGNAVADLGASSSATNSNFTFVDGSALMQTGAVTAAGTGVLSLTGAGLTVNSGVTASGASVALATTGGGALALNGHVTATDATAGTVTLASTGTISENAGNGVISAFGLSGSSVGDVTLGGANTVGRITGFTNNNAAAGGFSFINAGSLLVSGAIDPGASGVASLTTTGAASDLTISAQVKKAATLTAGRNLEFTAANLILDHALSANAAASGSVTFDGTVDGAYGLTTSAGTTVFKAGVGVTSAALSSLTVATGATTAAGDIKASGTISLGTALTLKGPSVTLTSTGGGVVQVGAVDSDGTARAFAVSTGGGFTAGVLGGTSALASFGLKAATASLASGNDVGVLAANLTMAGAALTFDNGVNALSIGTAGGVTGLTTNNGAASLTAAALSLDQAVNLGAGSTGGALALNATGAITQAAAITAHSLKVIGSSTVALENPGNRVDILAASLTGPGSALTFNNGANALTVGTVGAVSGVATSNGAASLTAGALSLAQAVNVGSAALSLVSTGAITQSGGVVVTAGSLTGSAGNGAILDDGVNKVAALGDFMVTSGGLTLKNDTLTALGVTGTVSAPGTVTLQGAGLTVGTGTVSGMAGVSLTSTGGGPLTLSNAVTASTASGAVTLTSGGVITEDVTNGAITASTLTGSSSGGLSLGGVNQVTTVTSLVNVGAGGLLFVDARTGPVSFGTLTAGTTGGLNLQTAGNAMLTGSANAGSGQTATLTIGGALTQTGGALSAGVLTGTSHGGFSLNQTGNSFGQVAALRDMTGDITLVDSAALSVVGPVRADVGALSVTAPSLTLASGGSLTAASQSLTTSGAVQIDAGSVSSTGLFAVNAGGAVTQTNGTINVGSLKVTAVGGIDLPSLQTPSIVSLGNSGSGAIAVTLTGSTTSGVVTNTAGDVTLLTPAGSLQFTGPVQASGALTLTSLGALNGTSATASGATALTGSGVSFSGAVSGGPQVVVAANGGTASFGSLSGTQDVTVTGGLISVSTALNVGRDLTLTGTGFSGVALNPTFAAGGRDFFLTDTAGGLNFSGLSQPIHAPRDLILVATDPGAGDSAPIVGGSLASDTGRISVSGTSLALVGVAAPTNGMILTATAGGIALSGLTNAGAGTAQLNATTTIAETGAGAIHAGTLSVTSGGAITLAGANAVPNVTALTNSGGGGVLFNDTASLVKVSSVTTGGGDIGLSTPNGALQLLSNVTSPGSLTISAAGALTAPTLTAQGGALAVTANGITLSGDAVAANNASLDSGSGDASLQNVSSTTGGSVTLKGRAITAQTVTAGTDASVQATGAFTGSQVTGGRDLTLNAASLNVTTASAGRTATLTTTGDTSITTLAAGQNLAATTGGAFSAMTTTAGGAATVNAGTSATLGSLTTGAGLSITAGGPLQATTLIAQGGDAILMASVLNIGTLSASGTVSTTSAGDTTIGSLTSGLDTIVSAGGVFSATTTSIGRNLVLTAGSATLGDVSTGGGLAITTSGPLQARTLTARNGDVILKTGSASLGDVLASGAITSTTTGDTTVAALTAGGGVTATAGGSLSAMTTKAGGAVKLTAGGSAVLGDVTGASLALSAGGLLQANSLTAQSGDASLKAGALALGTLTAAGAVTTSSTGDTTATALTSGTDTTADAGGAFTVAKATIGRNLKLTAGTSATLGALAGAPGGVLAITAPNVTIGAALGATPSAANTLSAGGATVTIAATNDIGVNVTGPAALTSLTAGRNVTVATAGGDASIGSVTLPGALLVTARGGSANVGLINLKTGGSGLIQADLDVLLGTGAATPTASTLLNAAPTALTIKAGRNLAAAYANAIGFASVTTGGDAQIFSTGGALTLPTVQAGGAVQLTGTALALGSIGAGGSLNARATTGDAILDTAVAGGDLSLISDQGIAALRTVQMTDAVPGTRTLLVSAAKEASIGRPKDGAPGGVLALADPSRTQVTVRSTGTGGDVARVDVTGDAQLAGVSSASGDVVVIATGGITSAPAGGNLFTAAKSLSVTAGGNVVMGGQSSAGAGALLDVGGALTLASLSADHATLRATDLTLTGALQATQACTTACTTPTLSIESRTGPLTIGDAPSGATFTRAGLTLDNSELSRIKADSLTLYAGDTTNKAARGDVQMGDLTVNGDAVKTLTVLAGPTSTVRVVGTVAPATTNSGNLVIGGAKAADGWTPKSIYVTGSLGKSGAAPQTAGVALKTVALNAVNDVLIGSPAFVTAVTAAEDHGGASVINITRGLPIGVAPTAENLNKNLVTTGSLTLRADGYVVQQNTGAAGTQGGVLITNADRLSNALILGRTGTGAGGALIPNLIDLSLSITNASGTVLGRQIAASSPAISLENLQRSDAYRVNGCGIGSASSCTPLPNTIVDIRINKLVEGVQISTEGPPAIDDPTITGAGNEEIWRSPQCAPGQTSGVCR